MQRKTEQPTVDQRGAESHPAFGLVSVSRITSSPGQVLFQSDIRHGETIRLSVRRATRQRDLHHDWVFEKGLDLIEIEMSLAQWASTVSSMNTSGVPCTIRQTESEHWVPGLPYDPRLAHSMAELKGVAERLHAEQLAALTAYEDAIARKAGAKELRELRSKLHYAITNAQGSVDFAAKSLNEHAENVVAKARADIESMVRAEVQQQGLTTGQTPVLELPSFDGEVAQSDEITGEELQAEYDEFDARGEADGYGSIR